MEGTYGKRPKDAKFKGSGVKTVHTSKRLAPEWLVYIAFFISFSVPNLVFSGREWFDTLHLMKWFVTIVPIGVISVVAGVSLLLFGARRTSFTLDPFGAIWLLMVLLFMGQPLVISLSSISTFAKEWFYFASLFAAYMLAYNLKDDGRLHRVLLWGGSVNASINVLFAELLIRDAHRGFRVFGFELIMDVSGNYIGNTAQQEMFGLWMAMAVLNCLFLHLHYVGGLKDGKRFYDSPKIMLNSFFLLVNAWGLWSSTTRGAILSLVVAFVVLVVGLWRSGDTAGLKRSCKVFGAVMVLLALVLAVSSAVGTGRGNALVSKMMDMIQNPTSVGSRISIWRTSWEVFLKKPVTGVGLGHYKWNFLDGQRRFYQKYPELMTTKGYEWQFTYWAHSEYIQWLCETGLIGSILLALLGFWWLYSFIRAMIMKKRLPPEALWGCAMLFLLWFDALFSRPFHRIENSVWMALAFALANRSLLPKTLKWTAIENESVYRFFGGFITVVSLYGLIFMADGLRGDKLIYGTLVASGSAQTKDNALKKAESSLMYRDDAREQRGYLYLRVGQVEKNPDIFLEGLKNLYAAFLRRPTSMLLFDVLNYSRQIGNDELFDRMAAYVTPDMLKPEKSAEPRER